MSFRKCGRCKKRYHKVSQLRKFIKYKYGIRLLHFGTLVLARYCYCGDNVKYGLFSKRLFQSKQEYDGCKYLQVKTSF